MIYSSVPFVNIYRCILIRYKILLIIRNKCYWKSRVYFQMDKIFETNICKLVCCYMENLTVFVKITSDTYVLYIQLDKNNHSLHSEIFHYKKSSFLVVVVWFLYLLKSKFMLLKNMNICAVIWKGQERLRGKLLQNSLISHHQKIVIDWLYPFRIGFLVKSIVQRMYT